MFPPPMRNNPRVVADIHVRFLILSVGSLRKTCRGDSQIAHGRTQFAPTKCITASVYKFQRSLSRRPLRIAHQKYPTGNSLSLRHVLRTCQIKISYMIRQPLRLSFFILTIKNLLKSVGANCVRPRAWKPARRGCKKTARIKKDCNLSKRKECSLFLWYN